MNSHAEFQCSAVSRLAVGCGCTDGWLQQLVEDVDVDVRVEATRGVERTLRSVVEVVSKSYPLWSTMQQRQEAAAARRRGWRFGSVDEVMQNEVGGVVDAKSSIEDVRQGGGR